MTRTDESGQRLTREAAFQDQRMSNALGGQEEIRDKFYFINRLANSCYEEMHAELAGKRVVVVGCSDGGVTPLARRGVLVEGIDISKVSIEKLNRSIEKEGLQKYAVARLMDAENLEFDDDSVDAISCSGVLHHLDSESALRSWARCLKPSGEIFMFEPLALHPAAALFRAITPKMRTPDEHPLREKDFALMRKYFGRVDRRNFGLLTPIAAGIAVVPGMMWAARLVLPVLEAVDAGLLKLVPWLGRFCWLTVVKLGEPRRSPKPAAAGSA